MSAMGTAARPKWRRYGWRWHAMIRDGAVGYLSLCGDVQDGIAHGQRTTRPPAMMRCGRCDGTEMAMAGKDESLDETAGWEALL